MACLVGDGDLSDGGTVSLMSSRLLLGVLLMFLPELNPKVPNEVLDAAFALAGTCLAADSGRPNGFTKLPSLVPGRLPPRVPFRLKLELGLGGGPMGLSTCEKKLDLRRSFGVDGRFCKLSIVRSLSDGREHLFLS